MANQIRAFGLRQINPTGKSLLIFRNRVKPRNQKYFASRLTQIRCISFPVSSHSRGVSRSSRTRGGMRWTRAVRVTNVPTRTAKSCRSDAPMLASSLREKTQATVSNKPGHRGEREVSRKPLRAGMPGQSGGPVVTNSCVCFHYTRGCGCIDTRHSPRPRFFQGDRLTHTSGAPRREIAEACREDERATFSVVITRESG